MELDTVQLVLKHPITQGHLRQRQQPALEGEEPSAEKSWLKWAHLLWDAAVADEEQVLQVGVEERRAHHGDAQTRLHDEAHRAVVRETDLCRRLLELGATERETGSFASSLGAGFGCLGLLDGALAVPFAPIWATRSRRKLIKLSQSRGLGMFAFALPH